MPHWDDMFSATTPVLEIVLRAGRSSTWFSW